MIKLKSPRYKVYTQLQKNIWKKRKVLTLRKKKWLNLRFLLKKNYF